MAAGGFVNRTKEYWLWQAECACELIDKHPKERWEQLMYLYLFRWVGYEE